MLGVLLQKQEIVLAKAAETRNEIPLRVQQGCVEPMVLPGKLSLPQQTVPFTIFLRSF